MCLLSGYKEGKAELREIILGPYYVHDLRGKRRIRIRARLPLSTRRECYTGKEPSTRSHSLISQNGNCPKCSFSESVHFRVRIFPLSFSLFLPFRLLFLFYFLFLITSILHLQHPSRHPPRQSPSDDATGLFNRQLSSATPRGHRLAQKISFFSRSLFFWAFRR